MTPIQPPTTLLTFPDTQGTLPRRSSRVLFLRRLVPLVVYTNVLLVAAWYADCRLLWIAFGVAPVLLLDQYAFRLLPWPEPRPKAVTLVPRLAIALVGGLGSYLYFRPYVFLWETLFIGIFLALAVSLAGSLLDLGVTLWRVWRGQPRSQPGPLEATLGIVVIVCGTVAAVPLFAFHLLHQPAQWTPTDSGDAFEEVTVVAGDGLPLAGWLMPCPDAIGSVIYCHGHGSNRTQVRTLVPLFKELRLNVLAFDFRGHGDSPGHTLTFGTREVEDVVGADAFLRGRFPGKPIVLMGCSYGASVVVQALPRLPHLRAAWVESGFARLSDMAVHKFGFVPEGIRGPVLAGYNTLLWLDADFAPLDVKPIDHLSDTRVPIFFCHGKGDDYVFFHEGQEMFAAYQGPKDHYWTEDVGHKIHHDRAEYRQRFHEFFARYLPEATR